MKLKIESHSDDAVPTGLDVSTSISPRKCRRRTVTRDGPEPVDVHVGARIRLRRTLLGLSQGELGKALDLTFQQVQKYERGANRVAASTLHRLARALDVPVSFFFDDLPEDMAARASAERDDPLMRREGLELLRHYYRVPESARKPVHDLVKAMARARPKEPDRPCGGGGQAPHSKKAPEGAF